MVRAAELRGCGDWVDWFRQVLCTAGRAGSTVNAYSSALRRWLLFCPDPGNPNRAALLAWLRDRRRCVGQSALNQELAALRAFYSLGHRLGVLPVDFSAELPRSKRVHAQLPRHLTQWQVGRLLAAPDLSTPIGFRDHTILRLVYETGIRARELVRLAVGDVLNESLELHVYEQHKQRFVPFSPEMGEVLAQWLVVRRLLRPGKRSVLFVSSRGRAFAGPTRVWKIVNRYAPSAIGRSCGYGAVCAVGGTRRPWSGAYPSLLRNAFTAALVQSGCDIRYIQEMLGLANAEPLERFFWLDVNYLKGEHRKLFK